MKIAELLLSALALLSLILRLVFPGSSEVFSTIAFLALSLFYLSGSVFLFNGLPVAGSAFAAVGAKRIGWAVAAGAVFALALIGILSALDFWKLAPFLWTLGMMLLVPVGAGSLMPYMLRPDRFHAGIALRAGLLLTAGIALVGSRMF